jgi:site-specific DNA-methyltransferase (adenine-specific)
MRNEKMDRITIGNCELYCGDTFDILPKLDIQVDAVISDPPFACTNCEWDVPIPLNQFWDLAEAKTKPTAPFVLFGTMRFAVALINARPNFFRYDAVWSKNTKCGFLWAGHQPLRSPESILAFTRPGEFKRTTYNPMLSPGGRVGTRSVRRKSNGVYGATGDYTSVRTGLQHPSSVLCFDSDRGNNKAPSHPTQKPVALLEWLIASFTNEGDTVLDCFMGAGSTAIACARTGRRFIGIEKEERYFKLAIERLNNTPIPLWADEICGHGKPNICEVRAVAS